MGWFFAVLFLFCAAGIGFIAQHGPGQLVIRYQDWMLECPLWLALLLSLASIFGIVFIQALFYRITQFFQRFGERFKQRRVLREQEAQLAKTQFLKDLQKHCERESDLDQLEIFWKAAPRAKRQQPEALALYAQTLIKAQRHARAEDILSDAIKQQWQDGLVRLYGLVEFPNPSNALKRAEKWLSAHPNNATLMLTLGRLSLQNQLWGKARTYLEQSIQIHPSAEAYAELGRLHESLGDQATADNFYKKGLLQQTEIMGFIPTSIERQ